MWVSSTHGILEVITDNRSQFNLMEFRVFAKDWDFAHSISSLYYAQSNRIVERTIQIVKRMLQKSKLEGFEFYSDVLA